MGKLRNELSVLAALALIVLSAGLLFGPHGAVAHDDEADAHPAHIHSGTCDQLGDVVYPLSNVSDEMMVDGTPMAGSDDMSEGDDETEVALSVTTAPTTLAELTSSAYAINVHKSAEDIGTYIACGNIGGMVMNGTDLAIGLGELNESGYSGIATLHDNGDGTTTVSVYLTEEYSDDESGHGSDDSSATPDDSAAAGMVAVSIANFAFSPSTLNVKVGDTVTWTNDDGVPHTVTQKPSGSGFQSGTLQPGDSFSYTFTTAGTFDYYCEFHAGMTGEVVVS